MAPEGGAPAGKTDILARMRFQPEKPLLMGLGTNRVLSMAVIGFIAPTADKKPAVDGVACRQIERHRQNEKKIEKSFQRVAQLLFVFFSL